MTNSCFYSLCSYMWLVFSIWIVQRGFPIFNWHMSLSREGGWLDQHRFSGKRMTMMPTDSKDAWCGDSDFGRNFGNKLKRKRSCRNCVTPQISRNQDLKKIWKLTSAVNGAPIRVENHYWNCIIVNRAPSVSVRPVGELVWLHWFSGEQQAGTAKDTKGHCPETRGTKHGDIDYGMGQQKTHSIG